MSETVLGVPIARDVHYSHDHHYSSFCPLDSVHDSHIHVNVDYGDETFDLQAFGPGIDHWSHRDTKSKNEWAWDEVPAVPSWWDAIRGRTLDAALQRMAEHVLQAAGRHARAAAVLDTFLGRRP